MTASTAISSSAAESSNRLTVPMWGARMAVAAEQAFRLRASKDVGHETPEHRDHEQVENARPYVEGSPYPEVGGRSLGRRHEAHQSIEAEEIDDKEVVGNRNESPDRELDDEGR